MAKRGQINWRGVTSMGGLHCFVQYYMYSLILFNGHERCVFYRFQSKNGHNNDAAQKGGKTRQKKLQQRLHSV